MALPYHLYIMATQHHAIAQVRPLAYGTALVLIVLVLGLNMTAVVIRYHYRRKPDESIIMASIGIDKSRQRRGNGHPSRSASRNLDFYYGTRCWP